MKPVSDETWSGLPVLLQAKLLREVVDRIEYDQATKRLRINIREDEPRSIRKAVSA